MAEKPGVTLSFNTKCSGCPTIMTDTCYVVEITKFVIGRSNRIWDSDSTRLEDQIGQDGSIQQVNLCDECVKITKKTLTIFDKSRLFPQPLKELIDDNKGVS